MEMESKDKKLEIEALIASAFKAARDKGKPDWKKMKLAVLKNRLLQLTNHEFSEQHFGFENLWELVPTLSPLVTLEGDVAVYNGGELSDAEPVESRRIRSDLWELLTSSTPHGACIWDISQKRVIEGPVENGVPLPVLDPTERQKWMKEFTSAYGPSDQLKKWLEDGSGSLVGLSQQMGYKWINFSKKQISQLLTKWATSNSIPIEQIFQPPNQGVSTPDSESLRKLVTAIVSIMTNEELADLRISPQVILRAKANGKI